MTELVDVVVDRTEFFLQSYLTLHALMNNTHIPQHAYPHRLTYTLPEHLVKWMNLIFTPRIIVMVNLNYKMIEKLLVEAIICPVMISIFYSMCFASSTHVTAVTVSNSSHASSSSWEWLNICVWWMSCLWHTILTQKYVTHNSNYWLRMSHVW